MAWLDSALSAEPDKPAIMLLHHWRPDVALITHLVPIGSFPGPMPFA